MPDCHRTMDLQAGIRIMYVMQSSEMIIIFKAQVHCMHQV